MPIYMKIDGVKGRVTAEGHEFARAGGAAGDVGKTYYVGTTNGGVWKSMNPDNPGGIVELSRISLFNGGGGIHGRDAFPMMKVTELFNTASRQGPVGNLYVATDAGVYRSSGTARKVDPLGRLLIGTEGGVWNSHSTGALRNVSNNNTWRSGARMSCSNNLKQLGIAVHNAASVEIFVSDAGASTGRAFLLKNVTISPSGPTGNLTISFNGLE